MVLGGFSFSSEALAPKLEKLSPLKGFKRMFSARSLMELIKAMAKFLLIGGITILLRITSYNVCYTKLLRIFGVFLDFALTHVQ